VRRYLARALLSGPGGGRALFLLAVAGVALGVGSVLSIEILDQGAIGAFAGSVRAVSGEAALTVLGRGGTLPDALLPAVLSVPGVKAARPVVKLEVAVEARPGASLELVGTDLLSPSRSPASLPPGEVARALAEPGWVAVTVRYAAEMGWERGSRVWVSLGSRRVELLVGALVDLERVAPLASRRLAVMDIAQVQALFGAQGRLTSLDVVAEPGEDLNRLRRRLGATLGEAVRVETPEERVAEAGTLLEAFRLNLTALSMVSLLVGGFLVYASTEAALYRRREELGILRCLGATRGEVLGLVLLDAALLGLLGTAAGVPLGWLAARANLGAVSATLRTVYLLEGVERVTLSPGLFFLAVGLGLGGALLGALFPALEVARADPRALLLARAGGRAHGPRPRTLFGAGLAILSAVAALVLGPLRGFAPSGFALALALLGAAPLSAPLLLQGALRLGPPRRLGVAYGARDLAVHLRSTAVAAGALAVAVSMVTGITVMVGSFRRTVEDWLAATLRADVYVTTPSWRRGRGEAPLDPAVVSRLSSEHGVRAIDRLRQLSAEIGGRRVAVSGFDAQRPQARDRVQLLEGDAGEALDRLRRGAVLVSEPLLRKWGLGPRTGIVLDGPHGEERFEVAGVYRDYGAEGGSVLMDLATLEAHFGPGPLTNLALYLAPGTDPEAFAARLRAEFPGDALLIRSNRTLRRQVLSVFEETFAVTRLLEGMGLVVAVAGVTLSLLVLARERSSEIALYRSLGATRAQVFQVFVGRGLGIALAGLLLGALSGAGLALVLVDLVNPTWFGWSLTLHPPLATLVLQALALLGAALLASLYPALRASRTPAAELARDAL